MTDSAAGGQPPRRYIDAHGHAQFFEPARAEFINAACVEPPYIIQELYRVDGNKWFLLDVLIPEKYPPLDRKLPEGRLLALDEVKDWVIKYKVKVPEGMDINDRYILPASHDAVDPGTPGGGAVAPADLLTTDELARLAMVEPKTLHNKLSEGRKAIDPQARPPESAIKRGGQTPDSYSYAAIRAWLLFTWPTKSMRFPESFDVVKRILASDKPLL
jgi:hypothetical protein